MKLQHKNTTPPIVPICKLLPSQTNTFTSTTPPHYIVLTNVEHRLQANNINADKMKTIMMIL